MAKTVFIGHPIGGDIRANVAKVLKICEEVRSDFHDKSANHRKPQSWGVLPDIASQF